MIESRLTSALAILLLTITRQRHERRRCAVGSGANALGHRVAVLAGQPEVAPAAVGITRLHQVECADAIMRGAHLVAVRAQEHCEALHGVDIVIDEQQAALVHVRSTSAVLLGRDDTMLLRNGG